jgi:Linear amide C-N hydrolases, choloylglycine hydrolase family
MLYLKATDFGPRDPSKPGVQAGLWSQYLLDNAATVKEALAALETVQVVMVETHGHKATVHLAIEDATGDSAIIEFVDGKRVVHHGREYRIMTNDPTYDEQLALLKKMDFSKPSSDTPLPGNVKATDRFQATRHRRRPGTGTHPIARASIHGITWPSTAGFCRPMRTQAGPSCTAAVSSKRPVGRTPDDRGGICTRAAGERPTRWPRRRSDESRPCTRSRRRSGVSRRTTDVNSAAPGPGRCSRTCTNG